MKKIFAVLLALALMLTLSVSLSVSAASWTGDITIEGSTNVPVAGKTFNAYKVLNAEAVDATDLSKGVLYSIPAKLQAFYNTLLYPDAPATVATADEVVEYIKNTDRQAFAKAVLDAAIAADIQETASNGNVFENLPFGYYVIEDTGLKTPVSALMLKSNSETVTIKADKPFVQKKINGDEDADDKTNGPVDYNTAKVGEQVPYVVTSKVPDMTGYTAYTYKVVDTLSAGLTFYNNVAVKIGTTTLDEDDFTVSQNGQEVTIEILNFKNYTAAQDIVITYSATVNDQAIVGVEGNPNTVKLVYSNDPYDTTTEASTEDTVYTYLVSLIVNKFHKVDGQNLPLAGATFELYEAGNDEPLATVTSGDDGVVDFNVTLKNGATYTIVETNAPNGYNKAPNVTFTATFAKPDWTSDNGDVVYANGIFQTSIENKTGILLPETGGIGTTIFYVVGGLLMVAAFVLLVSKKRMNGYA